ncbi:MAG TPA: hypothetical protein GX501_08830 [Clostridiaceae bacterium]|nr:hypothetical protein [Clostridiaceae bacterium]
MTEKKDPKTPDGFRLLMNVEDDIEAGIIESKLKTCGIDTIKSYREQGDLLNIVLGKSFMGVDILVPEDKYEEARNLLDSAQDIKDEEILADESFNDETAKASSEAELKKLNRFAWIMVALVLVVIAAAVVLALLLR